jgi:hypothetical protein
MPLVLPAVAKWSTGVRKAYAHDLVLLGHPDLRFKGRRGTAELDAPRMRIDNGCVRARILTQGLGVKLRPLSILAPRKANQNSSYHLPLYILNLAILLGSELFALGAGRSLET